MQPDTTGAPAPAPENPGFLRTYGQALITVLLCFWAQLELAYYLFRPLARYYFAA